VAGIIFRGYSAVCSNLFSLVSRRFFPCGARWLLPGIERG
jgi:hypothetical protein